MAGWTRSSPLIRITGWGAVAVVCLLIGRSVTHAHPAQTAPHVVAAPPVVERITATVAAGRSFIVAVPDESDGGFQSFAAPVHGLTITHALYTPPATTTTKNGHKVPLVGVSSISLFTLTARTKGRYTVRIVQQQPFGHNPPAAQEVVTLTFL